MKEEGDAVELCYGTVSLQSQLKRKIHRNRNRQITIIDRSFTATQSPESPKCISQTECTHQHATYRYLHSAYTRLYVCVCVCLCVCFLLHYETYPPTTQPN